MTTLRLLMLFSFLLASNAAASTSIHIPTDLKLVGSANLSVWWWDIYNAELYNSEGMYRSNQGPLVLKITYQREIQNDDLLEETAKQWQRFSIPQNKINSWLEQVAPMWPNVAENDTITFYIDNQKHGHFFFNEEFMGSIPDPEFSEHFVNIWLAANGPYPKMTQELTGADK